MPQSKRIIKVFKGEKSPLKALIGQIFMLKQTKMKKFFYYFLLIFISLSFFIVQPLYADIYGIDKAATNAGVSGLGGETKIPSLLGTIAGAAIALAGGIFVFLLILGGVMIMTAAGSPEKAKKGQGIIVWAIIGALVLGAAAIITTQVFNLFK